MTWLYRQAEEPDLRFVVASWVDCYRTAYAAGLVSMDDWEHVMAPQVRKVLARPGCQVWVAAMPGETDRRVDLKGWIAVERGFSVPRSVRVDGRHEERLVPSDVPLVHFVYVKEPYRRGGIARGLFAAAGVDPRERFFYTCKTGIGAELARSKASRAEWRPLIARYRRRDEELTPRGAP